MRLYPCLILTMAILILAHPTACTEVAYAVGPDGEEPVGYANITEYKGTEVISFTTSTSTIAPPTGPSTGNKTVRAVDSIKDEINKKIDIDNPSVRDEALRLVGKRSGVQRIDQICSIYDYMVDNWIFVSDPRGGSDLYQYSNYTLKRGSEFGASGKGDCDDFSILLASLVDSIGGTPRIVLAYSPDTEGHAYTEVYLGKKNDRDVERMQKWLKTTYNVNAIYIHEDLGSGDLWLNMDWWKAPDGAKHPGGPFYQAITHIPIYIQEYTPKTPLTAIENQLPIAFFSYEPLQPEVDCIVSFNAIQSNDPDGNITSYEWDFGDGENARGGLKSSCRHIYTMSGKFLVNLTVTDNEGAKSSRTIEVVVSEPLPEAVATYSPANPRIGDVITFDASQSKAVRGRITDYEWDFDDGYYGKRVSIAHQYWKSGNYSVKLIVTNDKSIKGTSTITIFVDEKENASGWFDKGNTLYDQGKYDEAIQAYDEVIRLDPNNAEAWNNKGNALKLLSRTKEADSAFAKAKELGFSSDYQQGATYGLRYGFLVGTKYQNAMNGANIADFNAVVDEYNSWVRQNFDGERQKNMLLLQIDKTGQPIINDNSLDVLYKSATSPDWQAGASDGLIKGIEIGLAYQKFLTEDLTENNINDFNAVVNEYNSWVRMVFAEELQQDVLMSRV